MMTIGRYDPASSFIIKKNKYDFEVVMPENNEDKFYGSGFVDGPNVPAPSCDNDIQWHDRITNPSWVANFDKPIC